MGLKWIFSYFIILAVFKLIESGKLTSDLLKQQQLNMMMIIDNENATTKKNLTEIKWAHAVNSQKELTEALKNDVQMIEADVILGKFINDSSNNDVLIPVMGHPPANSSDITLNNFLNEILDYNDKTEFKKKGVKLDFKSIEVFENSIELLQKLWPKMSYPIWLNADIIKGPVKDPIAEPVDANKFLNGCKNFKNATLSVGWTTKWGSNYSEGMYSDNYINDMIETLKNNSILETKQPLTFPVRAGIAAQSQNQLHHLVNVLNTTNDVTLTIWSSHNDSVDIDKLRNLIFSFGLYRVYLDVPEEISSKLDLGKVPNNGGLVSIASFGIISLCLLIASYF